MLDVTRLGRVLCGFGMIGLGGLGLAYADFVLEWTPVPEHFPVRMAFAYVHGLVLILAGLGLLFDRTVRPAALTLAAVWLAWTLLHVPLVIANWRGGSGGVGEGVGNTRGPPLFGGGFGG